MRTSICFIAAYCIISHSIAQTGNVGIGTTIPKARLHVTDSSVLFSALGDIQSIRANTPVNGIGRRMLWYPDKSAFRAGYAVNNEWDSINIGKYSMAMGNSVTASGIASTCFGYNNSASGDYSTVIGHYSRAGGNSSFAIGSDATALGSNSIAMGLHIYGNGPRSVGIGEEATTIGTNSISIGFGTTAQSAYETVLGMNNEGYAPVSTTNFNPADRLFVVGNGSSYSNSHNAFTILKNGNIGVNTSVPLGIYDNAQLSVLTASSEGMHIKSTGSDLNGLLYLEKNGAASNIDQFVFFRANGADIGSIIASSASSIAYNTTSDERLKENIRITNLGLKDVLKIKVEDYNYKSDKALRQTGFIAQQLYNIYPMAVTKGGATVSNPWMIDYSKLTPLLVKAIQDQQTKIETDHKEIEAARKENKLLKKRLDAIEAALKRR